MATVPDSVLLFHHPSLNQIIERALTILRERFMPAAIVLPRAVLPATCTVTKIRINSPRPMRELIRRGRIDMAKIAHRSPLYVFSAIRRRMVFSEISAVDV